MIKKAVIVAAGLSSRLYPLTLEKPKPLLPVNGKPLLLRSIELLQRKGVTEIAVVTGYKREMITRVVAGKATTIPNPFFPHCNNMGSLWFAKDFTGDDPFLYLHGDLIFHEKTLDIALRSFSENNNDLELMTAWGPVDAEAMKVRCDQEGYLLESSKEIPVDQAGGEWIGLAAVGESGKLFATIEEILFTEGLNYYDTQAFTRMAAEGYKVFCVGTGLPWVEIDFLEDYERAEELAAHGKL